MVLVIIDGPSNIESEYPRPGTVVEFPLLANGADAVNFVQCNLWGKRKPLSNGPLISLSKMSLLSSLSLSLIV